MKTINRYSILAISALVLLMLIIKAITIPITHDESATTVFYANFSSWQIMMYPDQWPNNHILNTLLVKGFIALFGASQLVVRLPNLIALLVYFVAAYRITHSNFKPDSLFVIPCFLVFVANLYLLDFFGLCRGYGIACALATLSCSYLLTAFQQRNTQQCYWAFALALLASYANFTLLVYWSATCALICFYFFTFTSLSVWQKIKPLVVLFFCSLLYIALIAVPIIKMQSSGQFQYWSARGFYYETILPLIDRSTYDSTFVLLKSPRYIAFSILALLIVNGVYLMLQFKKASYTISSLNSPMFIVMSVLLLTAFISIFQSAVLKIPNLNGRTALFFYPLFVTSFVSSLSLVTLLKQQWIKKSIAFCVAAGVVFQLSSQVNFRSFREWYYDENTFEVMHYLQQQTSVNPISLKTNWLFHPSFNFYTYTGKAPWLQLLPYDKTIDSTSNADYYYIFSDDFKTLQSTYSLAHKFSNDRWLLKKKHVE